MKRVWRPAAVYLVFLAVAFGAMGWVSHRLLLYERAEAEASRAAAVEEKVRLALWRMETALAPLMARESARPAYEYLPFHSGQRMITGEYSPVPQRMVKTASPLLVEEPSPYVKLYFQFDAGGALSSPQRPQGLEYGASVAAYGNDGQIAAAGEQLKSLRSLDALHLREEFLQRLPMPGQETTYNAQVAMPVLLPSGSGKKSGAKLSNAAPSKQEQLNIDEMNARLGQFLSNSAIPQNVQVRQFGKQITVENWTMQQNNFSSTPEPGPEAPSFGGMMIPLWVGDDLFLARRVAIEGGEQVQGIWLDWDYIRNWLLGEIRDLLPGARLEPVDPATGDDISRRLAGLPVRLAPGVQPNGGAPHRSLVGRPLAAAWICLVLAAAAVGGLMIGLISLSERRRSFVTAVSHELRTPLTTFSMYTELLSGPLGKKAEKRAKYVRTLRGESRRLVHMVENILAYARLENGRYGGGLETLDLAALVGRNAETLRERCSRQEMTLMIEGNEPGPLVRVNPTAVEQILFNLVDNACKYGHTPERREIRIEVLDGSEPGLRVSDRGPGLAPGEHAALFKAFHKSAQKAAKTAPGVGLGLALSRRLARAMGGNLVCENPPEGASFVLRLKRDGE